MVYCQFFGPLLITNENVFSHQFVHSFDFVVIERHQGRIIFLTYEPQDTSKVTDTLMFVGKGVTYDTGGADIKAGGVMAGMSRDKCGAAAVAGFMKASIKIWRDIESGHFLPKIFMSIILFHTIIAGCG